MAFADRLAAGQDPTEWADLLGIRGSDLHYHAAAFGEIVGALER